MTGVDKYVEVIKNVINNCNEAASIPEWTEHWFSSDRYEMDASQGSRLIALLNNICDACTDDLYQLYDQQVETQKDAQQAYSDYINEREKWHKFKNCKEQFDKIIKPFIKK